MAEDFEAKLTEYNQKLKSIKSRVSIFKRSDRLWLRGTLPVKDHLQAEKGLKPYQQAIALGKLATNDLKGLNYAFRQAQIVNSQLINNTFNWQDWLLNEKKANVENDTSILSVWEPFKEYKESILSVNTINLTYKNVDAHIKRLDNQGIKQPEQLKPWLLDNTTLVVAKQVLMLVKAAYNYAIEKGVITENPLKGVTIRLKSKTKNKDIWNIDPFTKDERDLVIEAFQNSKYSEYTDLVKFLFFTGCRPSEAIALQTKHFFENYILFEQTLTRFESEDNSKVQEGLKSQKSRKFPVNSQLKDVIQRLVKNKDKNDFVFKTKAGYLINWYNFRERIWNGCIIKQLVSEGKLDRSKRPYQTRHTFITMCLESGIDAKDVAEWVGNTPEIIYKHYAGSNKNLQVPIL